MSEVCWYLGYLSPDALTVSQETDPKHVEGLADYIYTHGYTFPHVRADDAMVVRDGCHRVMAMRELSVLVPTLISTRKWHPPRGGMAGVGAGSPYTDHTGTYYELADSFIAAPCECGGTTYTEFDFIVNATCTVHQCQCLTCGVVHNV